MSERADETTNEARLVVATGPGAMGRVAEFVERFAGAHFVSPDDVARVLVMLEELLTNLEKYGNAESGGEARITLRLDGTVLTVDFRDDGRPFDPFDRPLADLDRPIEERTIGGIGLHLLRELSHDASYRRDGGHNLVRLVRHVALVPPG